MAKFNLTRIIVFLSGTIAMIFLVNYIVFAFTGPSGPPSTYSLPAPINVSGTGQVKRYDDINNKGWLGIATDGYDSSFGLTVGNSSNGLGIKIAGDSLFERGIKVAGDSLFERVGYIGYYDNMPTITSEGFGNLRFKARGGNYPDLVINASGNVGIGAAIPGAKLEIQSASNPRIRFQQTGSPNNWEAGITGGSNFVIYDSANSKTLLQFNGGGGTQLKSSSGSNFLNNPNGSNNVYLVEGAGNVGIGTTAPTQKLDVAGNIKALTIGANEFCINPSGGCITSWPIVNYGSTAGTAAEGNKTIVITTGAGLLGGSTITIGAGGTINLTALDSSPTNEIQGVMTGKGLQRDVSNNFGLINCSPNQVLKYSSGEWVCGGDNDTNTWQPNTQSQGGYVSPGSTNYDKVWKTDASGNPSWRDDAVGSSAITSVSANDGTLTISPTTGSVKASLNLSNANTWTGVQTFNANTNVLAKSGVDAILKIDSNSASKISRLVLQNPVSSIAGSGNEIVFQEGSGNGTANNSYFDIHHSPNSGVFLIRSKKTDGSLNNVITIPEGSGNVGIGTIDPEQQLTLTGSLGWKDFQPVIATRWDTMDINLDTDNAGTDAFRISMKGINVFAINDSGNVGIGTTDPGQKLEVGGNIKGNNFFGPEDTAFSIAPDSGVAAGSAIQLFGTTGSSGVTNQIRFLTGATLSNTVIINTDGNVGIGTTDPGAKLTINAGGGEVMRIEAGGDLRFCTDLGDCSIGLYSDSPGELIVGYGGNLKVGNNLTVGGNISEEGTLLSDRYAQKTGILTGYCSVQVVEQKTGSVHLSNSSDCNTKEPMSCWLDTNECLCPTSYTKVKVGTEPLLFQDANNYNFFGCKISGDDFVCKRKEYYSCIKE